MPYRFLDPHFLLWVWEFVPSHRIFIFTTHPLYQIVFVTWPPRCPLLLCIRRIHITECLWVFFANKQGRIVWLLWVLRVSVKVLISGIEGRSILQLLNLFIFLINDVFVHLHLLLNHLNHIISLLNFIMQVLDFLFKVHDIRLKSTGKHQFQYQNGSNKINVYLKGKSLLKLLTCQHFSEFPLLWFAHKITVYATLKFESIRNVLGLWTASIQRQSVVMVLNLHYWVIVSTQDPQSSHSPLPAIHHRLAPQTHLPGSFSFAD